MPAPLPSPFTEVNARLAALKDRPPLPAGEGHRDLDAGIWLSTEAGRGAALAATPGPGGLRLVLDTAGQSRWIALAFALPVEGLAQGRGLGLRTVMRPRGFVSFRPALRYLRRDGGFSDVFAPDYALAEDRPRETLSPIPIDHGRLGDCHGAEINMFFQGTAFDVEFETIEAFLMI